MTTHTATTLAYVRTSAGVVKVAAGEDVPSDALPGEVDRLSTVGAIVEIPVQVVGLVAAADDAIAAVTAAEKPRKPRAPKKTEG